MKILREDLKISKQLYDFISENKTLIDQYRFDELFEKAQEEAVNKHFNFLDLNTLIKSKFPKVLDYMSYVPVGFYNDDKDLTEIELGNNITKISNHAFSGCYNLERIKLPESIHTLRQDCFHGCAIKEIKIPDQVTLIPSEAFEGCTALQKVELGKDTKIISNSAFDSCYNLKEIKINDNLKKIKEQAFEGCSSLEEIKLPGTLQSIENEAFRNCISLKHFEIPFVTVRLGYKTFLDCTSLEEITIPKTMLSMGYDTFKGCPKLKTIIYHGTMKEFESLGTNWIPRSAQVVICIDGTIDLKKKVK